MDRLTILLLAIAAVATAVAVPQFGLPKLPTAPKVTPPSVPLAESGKDVPVVGTALSLYQKTSELVEIMRVTYAEMQAIAIADNPEVGQQMATKLQEDLAAATKILSTIATNPDRLKRSADEDEDVDAFEQVGGIFAGSGKKVEPETRKLSPEAQCSVDKAYRDGLEKCSSNTCSDAKGILSDAEAEECNN